MHHYLVKWTFIIYFPYFKILAVVGQYFSFEFFLIWIDVILSLSFPHWCLFLLLNYYYFSNFRDSSNPTVNVLAKSFTYTTL